MPPDIVGWAASALLLFTLGHQVYSQWSSGDSRGVSPWLFAGQIAASIGFTVYALLIESVVFIVTNALIGVSAVIGLAVCMAHRRRAALLGRTVARGGGGGKGILEQVRVGAVGQGSSGKRGSLGSG